MPVIKSAIKKLRRDRKREKENEAFISRMENAVRKARKSKSKKDVSGAFSLLDKALKKHLIHKNKAARLKSGISKADSTKPSVLKPAKTVPKKKPAKITAKPKTPIRKK